MSAPRWSWRTAAFLAVPVIAAILVLARAATQDLTIDEANTFDSYVNQLGLNLDGGYWRGGSNNHLLATLVMNVSVALFGGSPLAIRAPALLGAALFITASSVLVARLVGHHRVVTRVALLAVLLFNPLTMDLLVAARGYALAFGAIALLLVALLGALSSRPNRSGLRRWAAVSIWAGIAVIANYAFVMTVLGLLAAALAVLVLRARRRAAAPRRLLTEILCLGLPAAAIVGLVATSNLLSVDRVDAGSAWGTTSLLETFRSLGRVIFTQPNPFVTPPHLRGVVGFLLDVAPVLVVLVLAASTIWLTVRMVSSRLAPLDDAGAPAARLVFAWIALVAVALSLAGHLLLQLTIGYALPYTRTGSHLVPLLTLIAFAPAFVAPVRDGTVARVWVRSAIAAAAAVAVLFALSPRIAYFEEWKWNADVCRSTTIALELAEDLGVDQVRTSWELEAAGNYYAQYLGFGRDRLTTAFAVEMPDDLGPLDGPAVYALSERAWVAMDTSDFIVVYESRLGGTRVAVRNAPGVDVPATPVDFRPDRSDACSDHFWYEDRAVYPGASAAVTER